MSNAIRRALIPLTVVLLFGWFVSGCSGAASEGGAVGTSGEGSPLIGVQTSSGFVTIENNTGKPIVDTKISIRMGTLQYPYMPGVPRLAPGEKRNLSIGDFRSRDGGQLYINLRRPNEVLVTATDVDGKTYEGRVPWQ
jgi:hypothetical protein